MSKRFPFFSNSGLCLAFGILTIVSAGCGSPPGKPSADAAVTVTYGGEPVTEGMISLQNKAGEGGGAPLNSKGVANLYDVVLGEYIVTVSPPVGDVAPPDPGKPKLATKDYANIPPNVRRAEKSPLKATVKAGKNEFKFELKQ